MTVWVVSSSGGWIEEREFSCIKMWRDRTCVLEWSSMPEQMHPRSGWWQESERREREERNIKNAHHVYNVHK